MGGEGLEWFAEQLRRRPDLVREVLRRRSGEELIAEDERDKEECLRMGLEGYAEYVSRSARRFEPLLLLAASFLPPEEREEYVRLLEAVKEKRYPTFNRWLYALYWRYLLERAVRALEEAERRGLLWALPLK